MADTFAIKGTTSDDSILADLHSRRGSVHYFRRLETYGERTTERRTLPVIETTNELMDLLVFATMMLLWTSGIVMIIFSVYIMLGEYGLSVMAALDFYALTMILQCVSAFTNLLAAGVTTSLLNLDRGVAKRAIVAQTLVIITIILLSAEIAVGVLSRKEIKEEHIKEKEMKEVPPTFLQEEAKKKGVKCDKWSNDGCEQVYKNHVKNYVNYLIGSSSVALAIDVIILPVYIFVYKVTAKDIVEGNLHPRNHVSFSETPSLLSVNRESEDEGTAGDDDLLKSSENNQRIANYRSTPIRNQQAGETSTMSTSTNLN